jgi:hypothetical protein
MRLVTIEPGGVFGPVHDHKDRPGLVYILQGTITDHRDGVATDYGPGVGWPEDRNTTHWLENRGGTPEVCNRLEAQLQVTDCYLLRNGPAHEPFLPGLPAEDLVTDCYLASKNAATASIVRSISSSPWAVERNIASFWLGAR